MKNNELKPCLYCGSSLWEQEIDKFHKPTSRYICGGCLSFIDEDVINNRSIEDDLKRQLAEAQELVKDLAWKEKLLFSAVNYIDEFVHFNKFEVNEHVKENMNAVLATYEVLKKGEK